MKTGEMYTYALANPKAEFKSVGEKLGDFTAHFNEAGKLIDKHGDLVFPRCDMNWELVPESVDFMTAINSEKNIRYENWTKYYKLSSALEIMATKGFVISREMLNGKWFVE